MLEIKNLVVKYGLAEAIHNINFRVDSGKIVAILGNNGAGKSTTLKTIAGLQRASNGSSILFNGADITNMKTNRIVEAGIAYVPEGRQIFGSLTVRDNLRMGAYLRKDKKEIAQSMEFCFDLFPRIQERLNQMAGTLSGGEQQMLAISRALMSKPKFLMLDEPSMGLAPVIVEKIYETIDVINKDGVTILLVEQNANLAINFSDYAYTIANGNIIMEGNSKDLASDASFIKAFLGECG